MIQLCLCLRHLRANLLINFISAKDNLINKCVFVKIDIKENEKSIQNLFYKNYMYVLSRLSIVCRMILVLLRPNSAVCNNAFNI